MPVPTLLSLQLASVSPVRPEHVLAFAAIAEITQMSMIRLKARMTQVKMRQRGKRRRVGGRGY